MYNSVCVGDIGAAGPGGPRGERHGGAAARAGAGHASAVPRAARLARAARRSARRAVRTHGPAAHPRLRQQRHPPGVRLLATVRHFYLCHFTAVLTPRFRFEYLRYKYLIRSWVVFYVLCMSICKINVFVYSVQLSYTLSH